MSSDKQKELVQEYLCAVDAVSRQQINNLKSDDGHAVKNCIAWLAAGETADQNFAKIKRLYFEHKGNLAAVWSSPEYNHDWQEGSCCEKDLTATSSPCKLVTATEPTPTPAPPNTAKKEAMSEVQPSDTENAGDMVKQHTGAHRLMKGDS